MAVLVNKTQNSFTMISNSVLRDKNLSMKDRGVFCTLCSLPDGWEFSIAGLAAVVSDGVDAIRKSILALEENGYIQRTKTRGKDGKFISEIKVFAEKSTVPDSPSRKTRHGKSVADNPSRDNRDGQAVTVNPTEYNTDNTKLEINIDNQSISPSTVKEQKDRETEDRALKEIVAENIKLDWLLDVAERNGDTEVTMVNEIYDTICDMVCYPREKVVIKGTEYPWEVVKSRFLKLQYVHVAALLNRLIDADLGIKNMSSYLVSSLYSASLVGTMEAQAQLHDDYLKYLRGNPY